MSSIGIGAEARGVIVAVGVRPFGYITAETGEEFFFPFASVVDGELRSYLARLQRTDPDGADNLSIPVTFINAGKHRAGGTSYPTAAEVRPGEGWSRP